jgi:hypothetical protein
MLTDFKDASDQAQGNRVKKFVTNR